MASRPSLGALPGGGEGVASDTPSIPAAEAAVVTHKPQQRAGSLLTRLPVRTSSR